MYSTEIVLSITELIKRTKEYDDEAWPHYLGNVTISSTVLPP